MSNQCPVFAAALLATACFVNVGFAQSTAMQMAMQNMNRYGINPNNMRLPMGGGRTFVLNNDYSPGSRFSNGFGVINPRGQSFYSGQSTSFRGGPRSSVFNFSRPGFSDGQGWIQGGGLNGSRFSLVSGRNAQQRLFRGRSR